MHPTRRALAAQRLANARPLPSPMRALAIALAGALASGTVAYAALDYANTPMPAPTYYKHTQRLPAH